jgi:hypothetical protein
MVWTFGDESGRGSPPPISLTFSPSSLRVIEDELILNWGLAANAGAAQHKNSAVTGTTYDNVRFMPTTTLSPVPDTVKRREPTAIVVGRVSVIVLVLECPG